MVYINSDLAGYQFGTINGVPSYKAGADSVWVPLGSAPYSVISAQLNANDWIMVRLFGVSKLLLSVAQVGGQVWGFNEAQTQHTLIGTYTAAGNYMLDVSQYAYVKVQNNTGGINFSLSLGFPESLDVVEAELYHTHDWSWLLMQTLGYKSITATSQIPAYLGYGIYNSYRNPISLSTTPYIINDKNCVYVSVEKQSGKLILKK